MLALFRLSESASEDEHYYSHSAPTTDHNPPANTNNNNNNNGSANNNNNNSDDQFPSPRAPSDEFSSPRPPNDGFPSGHVSGGGGDTYNKRSPSDAALTYEGAPPVKKGRGRPKKVYDGVEIKEWSDDEIYKLIDLWGKGPIS